MKSRADFENVLRTAEEDLRGELQRTDNPWLACFTTRLLAARTTLELWKDCPDAQGIHARLDALLSERSDVCNQHGWDPPDTIKQGLLKSFRALLDVNMDED